VRGPGQDQNGTWNGVARRGNQSKKRKWRKRTARWLLGERVGVPEQNGLRGIGMLFHAFRFAPLIHSPFVNLRQGRKEMMNLVKNWTTMRSHEFLALKVKFEV
jgi:hypothetical protein